MLYTTLRALHILTGVFWAGGMLFLWIIVYPALKRAKVPAFPFRRAIPALMLPIMTTDAIILFGTGVWMTLVLKKGSLGTLFTTVWGWSVFISFLTLLIMLIAIFFVMPAGLRMSNLARISADRKLTEVETQELNELTRKFYSNVGTTIQYVLVTIQLVLMLILRYL